MSARTERLTLLLSTDERALLAQLAERDGRSPSDFLRLFIHREAKRQGLIPDDAPYKAGNPYPDRSSKPSR